MLARLWQNDLVHDFAISPVTLTAGLATLICVLAAILAPLIAPQDPFDPAQLDLMDSFRPPLWMEGGAAPFLLGTDDQGRDLFSAILYGMRLSLIVGFAAVALSVLIGTSLGLIAGTLGGWAGTAIMRAADVQLTIPGILVALLVDGLARALFPGLHAEFAIAILIFAIGISEWPQYARVTRAAALREREKDYVAAARLVGVSRARIMLTHILPNCLGPVFVLATLGLALAIIAEATLSFLGVGMPPTAPSLGTRIRIGNDFLFSGEWWLVLFPAAALVILTLSVNLLGDWLRDALDPTLKAGR